MGDTFSFDIDTRVAYAAIFVFVVGALVVLRFLLKVLKATLGTFGGSKLRKYAKKDAWAGMCFDVAIISRLLSISRIYA